MGETRRARAIRIAATFGGQNCVCPLGSKEPVCRWCWALIGAIEKRDEESAEQMAAQAHEYFCMEGCSNKTHAELVRLLASGASE